MDQLPVIELLETDEYYIFHKQEHSLWCCRKTGQLECRSGWDLTAANDPRCIGLVYGIIGKFKCFPESESSQLLVIERCAAVGNLPGQDAMIYKITQVALLSLSVEASPWPLDLLPCSKHSAHDFGTSRSLHKTWGTLKSATRTLKSTTEKAAALATGQVGSVDRTEQRLLEEVCRLFNGTDSFYFSPRGLLTHSLQRLALANEQTNSPSNIPVWRRADSRYFWNAAWLRDLINQDSPHIDAWIQPVVQGYIQIEEITIPPCSPVLPTDPCKPLILALISRRNVGRAGTRYQRRGLDEDGHVANHVETEQILSWGNHVLSWVQLRGSIPVYWSQTAGIKYSPTPTLDREVGETQLAFALHMDRELALYNRLAIVNLVSDTGPERLIGRSFLEHVLRYDSTRLMYVTFDFHQQCGKLNFDKLTKLTDALEEIVRDYGFTWRDTKGNICIQKGVVRVNCMDCLDRTNVVQTALGKLVLERQLPKLGVGVSLNEAPLGPILNSALQSLWANNGDVLSRQYAGTNALKGDFTRTGQRKFTGMVKDGVYSANRFYVNRFKDAFRQLAIDLTLGLPLPPDLVATLQTAQSKRQARAQQKALSLTMRMPSSSSNTESDNESSDEVEAPIINPRQAMLPPRARSSSQLSISEGFLPVCGILAVQIKPARKPNLLRHRSCMAILWPMAKATPVTLAPPTAMYNNYSSRSATPEILVNGADLDEDDYAHVQLRRTTKQWSHSSETIGSQSESTAGTVMPESSNSLGVAKSDKRSSSECDLPNLSLKNSHSEGALQAFQTNLKGGNVNPAPTSQAPPPNLFSLGKNNVLSLKKGLNLGGVAFANAKKMVVGSKLAKGVQSIGANLDPRKLKGAAVKMSRLADVTSQNNHGWSAQAREQDERIHLLLSVAVNTPIIQL